MRDDNPWKPIAEWQKQESADAARWWYVRDNLAWLVARYREKSALWTIRDPGGEPGLSFQETIDRLIAEEKGKEQ